MRFYITFRGPIRMKLDVPHGLPRLPPAPEFRRTQDTATTSHKEHIYFFVLCRKVCSVELVLHSKYRFLHLLDEFRFLL